jgi:TrmH family RNA methyltransferase
MISSSANARVKWVCALQGKRKARDEESLFVVEGSRWAEEVLAASAPVRLVMHSPHLDERGRGIVNRLARLGGEVLPVSDEVMAACSDTQTPQGLLLVLPKPNLPPPPSPSLLVLLDRLSDPGNLGTILRTALAAGVEGVGLTPGSVDAFNPKVVRATMGALLHLPVSTVETSRLQDWAEGARCWRTRAGQGVPYDQVNWQEPTALIIGGEAHGVSSELSNTISDVTHIPMRAASDSLNAAVATAVFLFEIRRQRGYP